MSRVPKTPALPLSRGNSRGVLLGSHTGKAYARVMRWQVLPHLELAAHPGQLGGLPGRTVALGTLLVRMHLRQAVKRRRPAAVLFVVLVAVFYRVLVETAVGPVLTFAQRALLVQKLGLPDQVLSELEEAIAAGGDMLPADNWLLELAHHLLRAGC